MKADWASAATDRAAAQGSDRSLWAGSSWVRVCVWLLLATGLAARLSPLLDVEGRLYWLLLSEDGYLMQTIARNMAIGLGMSTAHGTMPTNGVQPLATFLYAGLHALAGGSKMLAIGYVTVFATAVSAAAAWVFWRLGRSVLRDLPFARDIALLAAALWFASPAIVGQSMNGLETGLYYLAITTTLLYYFSLDLSATAPMGAGQRVALGLLLGVTFLARNDAVFFIAAVLAAHLLLGGASAGGGWRRRAGDAVVAGGLQHGRRFAMAGLQQADVRIGGAHQRPRRVAFGGLRCQPAHDPGQPGRGLAALCARTASAGNRVAGGRRLARRSGRAGVGGLVAGRTPESARPSVLCHHACVLRRHRRLLRSVLRRGRGSSRATCPPCRPCCGC